MVGMTGIKGPREGKDRRVVMEWRERPQGMLIVHWVDEGRRRGRVSCRGEE